LYESRQNFKLKYFPIFLGFWSININDYKLSHGRINDIKVIVYGYQEYIWHRIHLAFHLKQNAVEVTEIFYIYVDKCWWCWQYAYKN